MEEEEAKRINRGPAPYRRPHALGSVRMQIRMFPSADGALDTVRSVATR